MFKKKLAASFLVASALAFCLPLGQIEEAEAAGSRLPMIRLYNAKINDHFYTSNRLEADDAARYHGYRFEGELGYIYQLQEVNTQPVFRMWNPRASKHFYTTDSYEMEAAKRSGFVQEGILGFTPAPYTDGEVGVMRLYSPKEQKHFFTTNQTERDMLVGKGYMWEGYLGGGVFLNDVSIAYPSVNSGFTMNSSAAIYATSGVYGSWPLTFQYTGPEKVTVSVEVLNVPLGINISQNLFYAVRNNDFITITLSGIPTLAGDSTIQLNLNNGQGLSHGFGVNFSVASSSVLQNVSLVPDWSKTSIQLIQYGAYLEGLERNGQITSSQLRSYYQALTTSSNPEVRYIGQINVTVLDVLTGDSGVITRPTSLVYPGYYPVKVYTMSGDSEVQNAEDYFHIDFTCSVLRIRLGLECDYAGVLSLDMNPYRVNGDAYDADGLVTAVKGTIPTVTKQSTITLVYTSKDIKTSSTNYVVSNQDSGDNIALVSYYRLKMDFVGLDADLVDIYPARRLAIKTLGSMISVLDYGRPNSPSCPNYYFGSIEEFTLQTTQLCGETLAAHDSAVSGKPSRTLTDLEKVEAGLTYDLLIMDKY